MERFCNSLADTFLMAVSWGGYESLQIPTCVFYQEGLPLPSLPFNFVRFYAGLEEFEFLKNGLERAMKELF
jgi:cystathionine beta-lyase/cystathionine gamma-synthase